jgi:hypothetical protein
VCDARASARRPSRRDRTLSRGAERHYLHLGLRLAHQLGSAIGHRVRSSKQYGVSRVYVARCNRASLVADQRGNRRLAITKIRSERSKLVPQHVRGNIGRQAAERGYARPKFLEMQDRHRIITGCWKHSICFRTRQSLQNIAGGMRQRPDAPPRFRIGERSRAADEVEFDPTQPIASPLRQPVSARKRVAAIAAGHTPAASAFRNPSPRAAYSSSDRRRLRSWSAKRSTPCAGLSARIRRRMA